MRDAHAFQPLELILFTERNASICLPSVPSVLGPREGDQEDQETRKPSGELVFLKARRGRPGHLEVQWSVRIQRWLFTM